MTARKLTRMEAHAYKQFYMQRTHAAQRGIAWLLTFAMWWSIWQHSGRYFLRGRGRGRYCMARFGDKGPYAVGNVHIVTNEQNQAEMGPVAIAKRLTAANRGRFGRQLSAATKAKLRTANLGKPKSLESIAKRTATRLANGSNRWTPEAIAKRKANREAALWS
jgi:hypothetical protein